MLQAKVPKTKIAAMLGRDRSTITREIKRNWWHDKDVPQADGYWHVTAQAQAQGPGRLQAIASAQARASSGSACRSDPLPSGRLVSRTDCRPAQD
ncbi:helix-turn-helix domain-containing protein [Paracoccus sp. EF6]|uniref:Helix-turn-helix domain-containing protein n=1 Tax=Paracoccus benzoatiresistens TaxID=2997341 RepID=A0ABT4JAX5_9RHOB|nr:helix-turn-helix domain-containing protein [Paracoccus sp. EF6]MCZ0964228.1 helix-turn-helix domain-containing protein [Paracoccus sp. EF6]